MEKPTAQSFRAMPAMSRHSIFLCCRFSWSTRFIGWFYLRTVLTSAQSWLRWSALPCLCWPAWRATSRSVQDRLICLEMQTRMEKVFPAELRPRIVEFTPNQLIALRFAGDAELPALAQQVLDEKIADRKTIKSRVKNWRPDYMRA